VAVAPTRATDAIRTTGAARRGGAGEARAARPIGSGIVSRNTTIGFLLSSLIGIAVGVPLGWQIAEAILERP
jgi:hypothetical protein